MSDSGRSSLHKSSLFADLRIIFFPGLGLLTVGSFGVLDRNPEAGFIAVAGSILVLAAVVGNAISPTLDRIEENGTD